MRGGRPRRARLQDPPGQSCRWRPRDPQRRLEGQGKNGAGDPEYLTTHDPNGYPPSELKQAFEELLEEFPTERKEVDRDASLRMFELMLDNFLDDGVIDAKEMGTLCSTLLKFELFTTQAEAEQHVRTVAEDHNPGVVFEN